jgi:flagellar biosynthesis protein FlhG
MKIFEERNHYQVLKIPFDADWRTIKAGYRHALEIYAEDSLATHALFSEEEREDILQAIEEAFRTLSDPDKREAYNEMLLSSGQVDAVHVSGPKDDDAAVSFTILSNDDQPAQPPSSKPRDPAAWAKKKAKEASIQSLITAITGKEQIAGEDLKQLREAFGIDLSEIFESTRIAKTVLEAIEENRFEDLPAEVFSHAFVKSYARILQLDPIHVVEAYFKGSKR